MAEQTERVITEYATTYRQSDDTSFAGAYDMARGITSLVVLVSIVVALFSFFMQERVRAHLHPTGRGTIIWSDIQWLAWFAVWCVVVWLIYHSVLGIRKGQIRFVLQQQGRQTRQIKERTVRDGDTSTLDFESNIGYRLNGELHDRHGEAFHLDGKTLTGRNMHVIRLLASTGKFDRLRRDPLPSDETMFSWVRDLPDLPRTVTAKKTHYAMWSDLLDRWGYFNKATGKPTEKGVTEFLQLPLPPNDNNE